MESVKPTISPVPSYAYSQHATSHMGHSPGNNSIKVDSFTGAGFGLPQAGAYNAHTAIQPAQGTANLPQPHWRDLWAVILFYVVAGTNILLALVLCLKAPSVYGALTSNFKLVFWGMFTAYATTLVCALGLSAVTLFLMKLRPLESLHACFITAIAILGGAGFLLIKKNYVWSAVICGVLALVLTVFYLAIYKRLPFSAVVLSNTIGCIVEYPATMLASLIATQVSALCVIIAFSINYSMIESLFGRSLGMWFALELYVLLNTCWIAGVISNTLQTTVAGVFATWYFLSGTQSMPKAPTQDSAQRALTCSFGTICVGTMVVAAIRLERVLHYLPESGVRRSYRMQERELEDINKRAERHNFYTYTTVAIHGKPYTESVDYTVELLGRNRTKSIANRNYVGTCTFIMSMAIMIVSTLVAHKTILQNYTGYQLWYATFHCAVYACLVCMNVFELVSAGSTASFVCLAENPEAMRRTRPALYQAMCDARSSPLYGP